MKKIYQVLIRIAFKRNIELDDKVTMLEVLRRANPLFIGLLRGLICTRKKIVLMRGAQILAKRQLNIEGGLVRIQENCLLDCLADEGIVLGRNFKLGANSRMVASGSLVDIGKGISVGDNVGIGEFSYIGGAGGVRIGADCIIGQYFSVHSENHNFDDPNLPIRDQGVVRKGIIIGSGCWVGAKVTILDGVEIGNGCVIAAGALVSRSFPENCVIAGIPAKVVKMRTTDF